MKKFAIFFLLSVLIYPNLTEASRHHKRYRRHKMHAQYCCTFSELRGSHESQRRQNEMADHDNLERISNAREIVKLKRAGALVPIVERESLCIDPRLDEDFKWVRPWTESFLRDISYFYFENFNDSLQVNSAVRTIDYQRMLQRRNHNAAPLYGPEASSHLTGATIDIAKKGMTKAELNWMRWRLVLLEGYGEIEATEEFQQPVFHIMVFKRYTEF